MIRVKIKTYTVSKLKIYFTVFILIFNTSCTLFKAKYQDVDPKTLVSEDELEKYYNWKLAKIAKHNEREYTEAKRLARKNIRNIEKELKVTGKKTLADRESIVNEFELELAARDLSFSNERNDQITELEQMETEFEAELESLESRNYFNSVITPKLEEFQKKVKLRDEKITQLKKEYDSEIESKRRGYWEKLKRTERLSRKNLGKEITRIRENYRVRFLSEESSLISRMNRASKLLDEKLTILNEQGGMTVLDKQIRSEKIVIAQKEKATRTLAGEIAEFRRKSQITSIEAVNALDLLIEAEEYFYGGKYYDAMVSCQLALEIVPDLYLALAQLGTIYYKLGYFEKAEETYNKALAVNPDAVNEIFPVLNNLKNIKDTGEE